MEIYTQPHVSKASSLLVIIILCDFCFGDIWDNPWSIGELLHDMARQISTTMKTCNPNLLHYALW